MLFGVFPVSLRKICASITSTACTCSRIFLGFWVLIEIYFGFAVFYYYFMVLRSLWALLMACSGIPAPGIPSDWSVLTADINTEILNPLTCEWALRALIDFTLSINSIKNYVPINPLTAEWALRALIDFFLSNARRFYSSMGNPLAGQGLNNNGQKQRRLMLRMRFREQQFSQKTIPKLVRTRERSAASWAPLQVVVY